jgi:hypothetical protein
MRSLRPTGPGRAVASWRERPWRDRPKGLLLLVLLVLAAGLAVALVYLLGRTVAAPDLRAVAPESPSLLGAEGLEVATFTVESADEVLSGASWQLDGRDVSDQAVARGTRAELTLEGLTEGAHEVVVSASGGMPFSTSSVSWHVTVDATPPELAIAPESLVAERGQPHELRGSVEADARVFLQGNEVPLTDGSFALRFSTPPRQTLEFVARDAAGNESEHQLSVSVIPRQPEEPVRGVHVSAQAWANDALRTEILALVDAGLINTVQLDLKDEGGIIGYDSQVPLGIEAGATASLYDLDEAVSMLHERGVRVIGRLVVFRDPILAAWAWDEDRRGLVVQTPDGDAYAGYGGFTNPASRRVRDYNIDIAEEAARAGIDDILYDYVRRPDGPLETMVFPGLESSLEQTVVGFLEQTEKRLASYGTFIGASVFGIAALRPQDVAQDVERMAEYVDYVAPMVYPSHWSAGVYDVADPNNQPYDIVRRSLEDFNNKVAGRGARVLPWLQDFSIGVPYGPFEVRAQIEAARDAGVDEWLLWDPAVTYTSEALDPSG